MSYSVCSREIGYRERDADDGEGAATCDGVSKHLGLLWVKIGDWSSREQEESPLQWPCHDSSHGVRVLCLSLCSNWKTNLSSFLSKSEVYFIGYVWTQVEQLESLQLLHQWNHHQRNRWKKHSLVWLTALLSGFGLFSSQLLDLCNSWCIGVNWARWTWISLCEYW